MINLIMILIMIFGSIFIIIDSKGEIITIPLIVIMICIGWILI